MCSMPAFVVNRAHAHERRRTTPAAGDEIHALAEITDGLTPCVVGEQDGAFELLIGPEELDQCQGSVTAFRDLLLARFVPQV